MPKKTLVIYRECELLGRRFTARVFNVVEMKGEPCAGGMIWWAYGADDTLLAAVHDGEAWELEA